MIDIESMPLIADIPRVQAERRPNETALSCLGEDTSFGAFETRCNQVAHGLLELGVSPNQRIGYLAKNTAIYYEMLCGGAKIRAVMNAVNTRLAPPEIQFILSDAQASVLFVGAEFYDVIDQLRDQLPDLKTVIAIDGPHGDWPTYAAWRDKQSDAAPNITPLDDDDVIQLYTSGTTGLPKGVMLTNKNYKTFFELAGMLDWSNYDAGESVMNAMPLFHVAGVNVGILALHQGARTVVLPEIDPTEILRLVEEEKINHAFWVPAVILMLSQHPRFLETDFSSLRFVSYGASPIAEDLLRTAVEVMGAGFTQLYGLTETVGAATYLPPAAHDPAKGKLRSCGIPWPVAEVLCVDENDKSVPQGDVGEIVIKADFVMKGYWNRPDATEEAMRNGYFHTGDAGYFDEEGYLYIHDRVKDMIVSGGENVYPAEVENAIFGHPDVADVAVIGIPDDRWGEAVKALVVPKPGTSPEPADIIAYARERIAAYKAPKTVDFIEAMPRNPSGKILRKDLREPFWKDQERRVS
ncbi:MAG: long-chain-fatty-acid--CoA ligase [Pseudomonadota bacterium]